MSNKFEQLLDLLVNEETEKAESLFHEIVVEKSRDIYEGLAETTDETAVESKEETSEDKVEETAEDKVEETETDEGEEVEIEETSKEEATEEKTDEAEKTEEEAIEEVGGDATDELVKDISAEEEGEGDKAADDMGMDMDKDGQADADHDHEDTEERVADLEDALDELKAEFEKMMAGKDGDDMDKDESMEAPIEEPIADEMQPMEAKHDMKKKEKMVQPMETKHDMKKKEKMDEYKIQKSADNADHSDAKGSPVASDNKPVNSANAKEIAKGGAEEKGRPAPTAQKMADFENTPGKDKSTSYKKQGKADTADHSDKSAKSPVASK
jgi:hypothetical protein